MLKYHSQTSPPARGRGLKHLLVGCCLVHLVAPRAGAWIETLLWHHAALASGVAPRAGAWIETERNYSPARGIMSPPARGRGLKRIMVCHIINRFVAPRAGAWIETSARSGVAVQPNVAPRAGAWIETVSIIRQGVYPRRPPRGGVD